MNVRSLRPRSLFRNPAKLPGRSPWVALWLVCLCSAGLLVLPGCGGGDQSPPASEENAAAEESSGEAESDLPPDDESQDGEVAASEPPAPAGPPPFELTYLSAETELFVYARAADILKSSLVQTLAGGNLAALRQVEERLGLKLDNVDSVTLGVSDLQGSVEQAAQAATGLQFQPVPPAPPAFDPGGGEESSEQTFIEGESSSDAGEPESEQAPRRRLGRNRNRPEGPAGGPATEDGTSPTVMVVRLVQPDDAFATRLEAQGAESHEHQSQKYYRVPVGGRRAPFLWVASPQTIVVAEEPLLKSIIEQGDKLAPPTADLSFVKSPAHLVVAVVPKDRQALLQSGAKLRQLRLPVPLPVGEMAGGDEGYGNSDESFSEPSEEGYQSDSSEQLAPAPPSTLDQLLEAHASAFALRIDLTAGVLMDVRLHCDDADAAGKIKGLLDGRLSEAKQQWDVAKAQLPGVVSQIVQPLVDSLQANAEQTTVTLSTTLPESQQASLMMLPVALMGMAAQQGPGLGGRGGPGSEIPPVVMRDWEALHQDLLARGQAVSSAAQIPPGVEVKALSRWATDASGGSSPPLEVAIVAVGGLASEALACGHLRVTRLETPEGTRLKWVGVDREAPSDDPVRGLVPVSRGATAGRHPDNGVAAALQLGLPRDPVAACHLTGDFEIQVAGSSREVTLPDLRTSTEDPGLKEAGVDVLLIDDGPVPSVRLVYPRTTVLGEVKLVNSFGLPMMGVSDSSTVSGETVQRDLALSRSPLPDGTGLELTVYQDLRVVLIPFDFANLPLASLDQVPEAERLSLVWTSAPTTGTQAPPEGLFVDAQMRWRPQSLSGPQQQEQRRLQRQLPGGYDSEPSSDDGFIEDSPLSGDGGGGEAVQPPRQSSDRPLQLAVDLTGPLLDTVEAVGFMTVANAKTDLDTDLQSEQPQFREMAADREFVPVSAAASEDQPPQGLRVLFNFTPPRNPIGEVTQFAGLLKLRSVRERTETIIHNLKDRSERPIADRELSKYGIQLVFKVDEERILMRVLKGNPDRLAALQPVDVTDQEIADVTQSQNTIQDGRTQVNVFEFADGVPPKVGMKVVLNLGVKDIEVPLRFSDLPVPPDRSANPPDAATDSQP
jgi:hypothetical protein